THSVRAVVVGAGDGGRQLISSMLNDPQQHWNPVAIVDDDPRRKHYRYRGVSVRGKISDLTDVAEQSGASTVVIAIPSAGSGLVAQITDAALEADLDVKVLPGVDQLLVEGVTVRSVRSLEPSDLLGRHHVETDVESIAAYLAGKRVLVTGAGGSIGSELCRQIVRFSPAAVAFLDRDESALHTLALSIDGRADLESDNIVLADIRDRIRVEEIFSTFKPEIVFHSAALKHVNVLEHHASEALQTNVWGTLNLLDAAERHGVERFVNISTDKAADPSNVLGYSKRAAERLTAERSQRASGTYLSVRFGNVFGTNGSVIRTFAAQIEAGGPITVTDPQVTRYFMTVHEAVQLVIQAAAIGSDGEALVLEMGEPVSILEVARRMIELSHEDVRIVFTGLKPGEKLHEQLFGEGEVGTAPVHPMISHVAVPPLQP
ncbi:MAG: polysaccharide biosynthesis protein, partial [Actinomycetales bacterium]